MCVCACVHRCMHKKERGREKKQMKMLIHSPKKTQRIRNNKKLYLVLQTWVVGGVSREEWRKKWESKNEENSWGEVVKPE